MRISNSSVAKQMAVGFGITAQPVVWISLYSVATTGAGLPAGPFGLVGAIEGLSYLAVLGWAVTSYLPPAKRGDEVLEEEQDDGTWQQSLVPKLSRLTIVVAVATLLGLVADRGCVPNAKPILDYSAYLPVCDSEAEDIPRNLIGR